MGHTKCEQCAIDVPPAMMNVAGMEASKLFGCVLFALVCLQQPAGKCRRRRSGVVGGSFGAAGPNSDPAGDLPVGQCPLCMLWTVAVFDFTVNCHV